MRCVISFLSTLQVDSPPFPPFPILVHPFGLHNFSSPARFHETGPLFPKLSISLPIHDIGNPFDSICPDTQWIFPLVCGGAIKIGGQPLYFLVREFGSRFTNPPSLCKQRGWSTQPHPRTGEKGSPVSKNWGALPHTLPARRPILLGDAQCVHTSIN